MSASHLEEMGLDMERVVAAVDFLEAYAEFALSEAEEADDEEGRWTTASDAATALREAAQWALCFDPQLAHPLLDRAGALFHRLQQPFGTYLRVVSGTWFYDPPFDVFGRGLHDLEQLTPREESNAEDAEANEVEVEIPPPLLHPQQQAYLVLAAAASPQISSEFQRVLRSITSKSPHRLGVAPVGALGMPIRWFWRVGALLGDPESTETDLFPYVQSAVRRYEESIELARANDYCWRNAAAPVDVGDLDIIGVAITAARRFGMDQAAKLLEPAADVGAYPTRAILEIAMEYARADPGRPGATAGAT